MHIIWLVQLPTSDNTPLKNVLMANFATRLFASVKSMSFLLRVQRQHQKQPSMIVISPCCKEQILGSEASLNSTVPIVLITQDNFYLIGKNGDSTELLPLDLKKLGQNLLRVVDSLTYQQKKDLNRHEINFKDVVINPETNSFLIEGQKETQSLTLKEGKILALLIKSQNQVVTREMMMTHIWGKYKVSMRTIDTHISRLRSKLIHSEIEISNKYGDGYRIE